MNVKYSNSHFGKLKSGIKTYIEINLKFPPNVVDNSSDGNSFLHKLLLTNTQVSRLGIAFGNNSAANIELAKTQLHKIGLSGGFLGRYLGPGLKIGLSLKKNALKPLVKSVLMPLRLTAAHEQQMQLFV